MSDPKVKEVISEQIVEADDGATITVGARVNTVGWGEEGLVPGTVKTITDLDVDVDGEGVPFQVFPYVYVSWDDEEEVERFACYWKEPPRHYNDDPELVFVCEELVVLSETERKE